MSTHFAKEIRKLLLKEGPLQEDIIFAKMSGLVDPALAVKAYMRRSGRHYEEKGKKDPYSLEEKVAMGKEQKLKEALRHLRDTQQIIVTTNDRGKLYSLNEHRGKEQTFLVERTGSTQIQFTGAEIFRREGSKEDRRWHEVVLWRTKGGKYVLYIRYKTDWPSELPFDTVEVLTSTQAVKEALLTFPSTEKVRGYPPDPKYGEKQNRLLKDIEHRFSIIVSDALKVLPGIAEKID